MTNGRLDCAGACSTAHDLKVSRLHRVIYHALNFAKKRHEPFRAAVYASAVIRRGRTFEAAQVFTGILGSHRLNP